MCGYFPLNVYAYVCVYIHKHTHTNLNIVYSLLPMIIYIYIYNFVSLEAIYKIICVVNKCREQNQVLVCVYGGGAVETINSIIKR
jgi:hypothetical protein